MNLFVVLFLLAVSLAIHELSHAFMMQKHGIGIKEISLGFVKKIGLGPFSHPRIFSGAQIYVTPVLLGAYVEPFKSEAKRMEELPLAKRLDIYCAGPWSNLLFASLLLFVYEIIARGQMVISGLPILFLIWFMYNPRLRRFLNYAILPLAGLALGIFLVRSLFSVPTETVSGPIAIVSVTKQNVAVMADAILMGGILSFSIGMFNLLPLFPLDGGKAIKAFLENLNLPNMALGFSFVSVVLLAGLIVWAFACDIFNVFFAR